MSDDSKLQPETLSPPARKGGQALKAWIPGVRDIVVAGITLVSAVTVTQMQMGAANKSADADLIQAFSARISALEESNKKINELLAAERQEKTELIVEVAALKVLSNTELNFNDVVCGMLEAQPGINWAKVVRHNSTADPLDVDFVMLCVNSTYRQKFEIGPFGYLGLTDFEYWADQELAQGYYNNDFAVFITKAPLVVRESWILPDGTKETGVTTKFYYRFGHKDSIEQVEIIVGSLRVE